MASILTEEMEIILQIYHLKKHNETERGKWMAKPRLLSLIVLSNENQYSYYLILSSNADYI